MLGKKTKIDTVNTVLGPGTKMEGQISSKSSIRIDGEFKGDITTEGIVHVGKDGIIYGNIKAKKLTNAGFIEGNIYADEQIHLVKDCHVKGDLTSPAIEIENGALFNGRSSMAAKPSKEKKNKAVQEKNPDDAKQAANVH